MSAWSASAAPSGFSGSLSGRFDEQSFEMRRAEVKAGYSGLPVSLSAKYAFIQAQPLYGFTTDRHEVTLGASTHLAENWRVFGTGTYDLQQSVLVKDGVGFAYDDACFTYLMTFSESRDIDHQGSDAECRLQPVVPHARRFRLVTELDRHDPVETGR